MVFSFTLSFEFECFTQNCEICVAFLCVISRKNKTDLFYWRLVDSFFLWNWWSNTHSKYTHSKSVSSSYFFSIKAYKLFELTNLITNVHWNISVMAFNLGWAYTVINVISYFYWFLSSLDFFFKFHCHIVFIVRIIVIFSSLFVSLDTISNKTCDSHNKSSDRQNLMNLRKKIKNIESHKNMSHSYIENYWIIIMVRRSSSSFQITSILH